MTRLLFVHAHPDDETLATGVAILHHVERGDDVHVLTCTLGEEGEVIPAALAHLEGADGDPLAEHRRGELAGATSTLGVTSHLLGAADAGGRPAYRDSGMVGSAAFAHDRAFAGADLDEVAAEVRATVEAIGPDVVVTYDEQGGYGHPDHIRVHDAVRRALAQMPSAPPLFVTHTPRSWAVEDRVWLASHLPSGTGYAVPSPNDPYPPSVVDDDLVTHAVVDPSVVERQQEALRAHETQVVVGEGWFALSNNIASRLPGREGYALLDPTTGALVQSEGPAGRRPGLVGDDA
ncbi:N-acetyl-1-D-myo-inosityl-2-amino-2-deoxy-alpha-D-glucopyranoside deacetylase [Knoellia flava TL1]|uniref:N-acetyl-1-D-myo-inositol-2-amino-2-deoxy-alpha-D-glucopyranoside deacetylase n=2 Tax=Knoellia flava TaxID=913969 RepID=A0A8H9KTC0_9MICO|nr:N-acetyl-1-D-myo-inositol-2-amino-2-deoxy-alpha-D-glucopyranoside deacetylase [Knoellia flava]KGN33586.1 N-acetyl-1-D-myo-inosityl-2-amino-2-deoxy-alpha-D-glucopyranoside deacetylase [Knoellia flava TL1]GGB72955.1 1D-myo-inositol 2-acetamido-2-deoxy-alpha-D-glucopyranoside deacetylase [Knoellia flava]